jgi:RNA polymerase sigma-70 factor (ECF subfamily)
MPCVAAAAVFVDIDDFAEAGRAPRDCFGSEVAAQLRALPPMRTCCTDRSRSGRSGIPRKFAMSEGAVRVALHRGLASLTAKLRGQ